MKSIERLWERRWLRRALPACLVLILTTPPLAGCGSLYRNTIGLVTGSEPDLSDAEPIEEPSEPAATARVQIEALRPETALDSTTTGEIEIVWEIPQPLVEGFIIRYGLSPESLDRSLKLPADEIERYEDPEHGYVFRHRIGNVPVDRTVFVAMASYQGEQVSELSTVFPVQPTSPEASSGNTARPTGLASDRP